MKYFIIIILLSTGTYYGLKFYAAHRTQINIHSCGKDLGTSEKIKSSKSEDEIRAALTNLIQCVDKRMTFPSSMFFNKQEAMNSIEINKTK